MEIEEIPMPNKNGKNTLYSVVANSMQCPHCKVKIVPKYICLDGNEFIGYSILCRCPNDDCNQQFVCTCEKSKIYTKAFVISDVKPNSRLEEKTFSDDIQTISPSFCEIYNQAFAAHQMKLMQICGVGYRKALEFLIKDYIIFNDNSNESEVKKKNLGSCIQDYIPNDKIREIAKRAVWIGNDETHYERKWEDKDVNDLTSLIHLTIHWMLSEIETKRMLEEMPEGK